MPIAQGRRYVVRENLATNKNGKLYMEREDFYQAMNLPYQTFSYQMEISKTENTLKSVAASAIAALATYKLNGIAAFFVGVGTDHMVDKIQKSPGVYDVKVILVESYDKQLDQYNGLLTVEFWQIKDVHGNMVEKSGPDYVYTDYYGFYPDSLVN